MRRYPLPFAAIFLLAVAGILYLLGLPVLAQGALLLIIVIGGAPLLIETARQLWRREFGVDVIAILAIAGSAALGQYLAGAIIVLMLSGGEALEAFALRRARSSLSALAQRAPRSAHVRQGHTLVTIPASAVEIDMLVVVKPGELIPVDGVVVAGSSSVSEADLTGEPLPQRKEPGSLALSGSVNLETAAGDPRHPAEQREPVRADRAPRRGSADAQGAHSSPRRSLRCLVHRHHRVGCGD